MQDRIQHRVRFLRLGDTQIREELHEAASANDLRNALQAQGFTVLSVVTDTPSSSFARTMAAWPWASKRAKPNFSLFCREVRTLIQAGMTVVEAVDTLSARERLEGKHDSLAARLLASLQRGLSLSSALTELPMTPVVLIAAVRAGERTSNLVEALDDYLRFDSLVVQLRKKIVSAAIYPALVTAVGTVISLFLLLVVMPNFASMYENLQGAVAGSASLTVLISQWVGQHRAVVIASLVAAALGLAYWVTTGRAQRHISHWANQVPWIRNRLQDFELAMMYQALTLLLKGGYPMTEAMGVAAQSALSAPLQHAVQQARASIERGGSVSQALSDAQLCDEVGRRLMAAAERNGDFYRSSDVVSRLHGERFELFVERITRIAEPILLLAVALVVGGIVVMMYLPVFDMATQLR